MPNSIGLLYITAQALVIAALAWLEARGDAELANPDKPLVVQGLTAALSGYPPLRAAGVCSAFVAATMG